MGKNRLAIILSIALAVVAAVIIIIVVLANRKGDSKYATERNLVLSAMKTSAYSKAERTVLREGLNGFFDSLEYVRKTTDPIAGPPKKLIITYGQEKLALSSLHTKVSSLLSGKYLEFEFYLDAERLAMGQPWPMVQRYLNGNPYTFSAALFTKDWKHAQKLTERFWKLTDEFYKDPTLTADRMPEL